MAGGWSTAIMGGLDGFWTEGTDAGEAHVSSWATVHTGEKWSTPVGKSTGCLHAWPLVRCGGSVRKNLALCLKVH